MVAVAQLAEHEVVILGVAGSSPVGHPWQNVERKGPGSIPELALNDRMFDNRLIGVRVRMAPCRGVGTGSSPV